MVKLINIKKAPIEIATILAQDDTIKKLLIIDDAEALERPVPDKTLNDLLQEHYISMEPPVENRIEEYSRNTFISILVDTIMPAAEDNTRANFVLYVSTNMDHILLKDNKNRLLELCDKIIQLLQNKKISSAGQINFNSMSHIMLSEFHTAYRLAFSSSDQQKKVGDI